MELYEKSYQKKMIIPIIAISLFSSDFILASDCYRHRHTRNDQTILLQKTKTEKESLRGFIFCAICGGIIYDGVKHYCKKIWDKITK